MVAGTCVAAEKVVRSSWIPHILIIDTNLIRLFYWMRRGPKTESEVKGGLRVSAVDNCTWVLPSTELPEEGRLGEDREFDLGCVSLGFRQSRTEESGV